MQSNWEEEHSKALRQLLEKGMTFSEIARALNARFGTAYSRNAAIGRARRMGLGPSENAGGVQPTSPKGADLRRLRPVRAKSLTGSGPRSLPRLVPGHAPKQVPRPAPSLPAKLSTSKRAAALQLRCVAITPRHLALIELEKSDCRYPYGGDGEGEPITFCGHPRREGSSYCTSHFHLTSAPELRERPPAKARLRLVEAA